MGGSAIAATALQTHWTGQYYQSLVPAPGNKYDPNIDIVLATIHGAIPVTDTKLLATAALLRSQWGRPELALLLPDQRGRPTVANTTLDNDYYVELPGKRNDFCSCCRKPRVTKPPLPDRVTCSAAD
jgi:hypothetical protein